MIGAGALLPCQLAGTPTRWQLLNGASIFLDDMAMPRLWLPRCEPTRSAHWGLFHCRFSQKHSDSKILSYLHETGESRPFFWPISSHHPSLLWASSKTATRLVHFLGQPLKQPRNSMQFQHVHESSQQQQPPAMHSAGPSEPVLKA